MRTPWISFSLLALTLTLGCSDSAGNSTSTADATTEPTTDDSTTNSTANDSVDTTADTADTADTGPADEGVCVHHCMTDDECKVGGSDVGLTCVDSLCTGGSECTTNDECIAQLSGWKNGLGCTPGGGECEISMQVCLEIDGAGHCVLAPSMFVDCVMAGLDEIETTDIDGNMVTVCGQANATCDDGTCTLPCAADADCVNPAYPQCNVDTGICQCTSDANCVTLGQPYASVCHAGVCGCGDDQACIDANLGNICITEGYCGCTNDDACIPVMNPYDGGTIDCVVG